MYFLHYFDGEPLTNTGSLQLAHTTPGQCVGPREPVKGS